MTRIARQFGTALLAMLGILPGCLSQTYLPSSAAPASTSQAAHANPYNRELAAAQRELAATTSAPQQAALLDQMYAVRDLVDDAPALQQFFSTTATDARLTAAVREQARRYAQGAAPSPDAGTTLIAAAEQEATANPQSADALETLGAVERVYGRPEAYGHLEQAARLQPTVRRWLQVAAACGNSTCTFAALTQARNAPGDQARVTESLVAYYASRGQVEKARLLATQAMATAPDDFVIRRQLADLRYAEGQYASAVAELEKIQSEFPGPLSLKRDLAGRYERMGLLDRAVALYSAAMKNGFGDSQERAALARIFQKRGETARLRALYAGAVQDNAADVKSLAALATLDAASGNMPAAEKEMRAAMKLAPDDASLHQQWADALAVAGRDAEAQEELELALAHASSKGLDRETGIRRRLAAEAGENPADPDAPYLVNAASLAAQARGAGEKAPTVELADVRVQRVAANGLATTRSQQVTFINSDQAASEWATRSITYGDGSQKLEIVRARDFKADGRVVDGEDLGDGASADATAQMYYDTRTRKLHFANVEKGDVIELDYRVAPVGSTNPYGNYFGELVTFGSGAPRKLQRYVLVTPADRQFHLVEVRVAAAKQAVNGNQRVYEWEARNLAPLPNEPKGPATTEVAPYVTVSTFADWKQFGQWYAQLIAPQFALDATLREQLQKLLVNAHTDQEKIEAIHHFVLRNTHYVALEFGIFSYKPYPVSQVYARRFGDCKDKASLMVALMRAAGIEADLALVRTRKLGEVAADATSISIFNHAVAYVPKYGLWLDGTAEYAGSHELPIDDQGAMALTVGSDGQSQMRRIPTTLPLENYTHRQVRAELQADGQIQFSGSTYTRGEDAPGLRREFEVAERQRDSFRNRLAEVLPAVRVDSVKVDGAQDLERDVVVSFRGQLDSYAGGRVVSLTPSWMKRAYVQTLAPLASRTEDLLLPAPWTTEEELHFVLPSGARVLSLPQDTNLNTPFGAAVLRYERAGNEVVVKTSVQFRKLRIAPAEYAAFRDFCAQVESAFKGEVRVGL